MALWSVCVSNDMDTWELFQEAESGTYYLSVRRSSWFGFRLDRIFFAMTAVECVGDEKTVVGRAARLAEQVRRSPRQFESRRIDVPENWRARVYHLRDPDYPHEVLEAALRTASTEYERRGWV